MKLEKEFNTNFEESTKRILPLNLQHFAEPDTNNEPDTDDKDDDVNDPETDDGDVDGDKSKSKSKTFTQDDVKRMIAEEKKQGRTSILKELGLTGKEDISKIADAFKKWRSEQMTDEEKEKEAKSANDERVAELERKANMAIAQAEALKLGAKADCVEDVVALAVAKKGEDDDLKTVISELKTKYAHMFNGGSDDDDDSKKKKKSTGTSLKNVGGKTKTSADEGNDSGLGARLAAQRKGNASKKSYWSK